MTKHIAISFIVSLLFVVQGNAQCSNFDAQWPTGTQSTTSNSLVTATTCAYGGEYAAYNVTAGETYTWTTCGDTDFDTQLTLWNTAHTVSYAYNDDDCGLQSTITWVATFTGTVHVLVSEYNCASNATCMTVQWACTTCGVVPTPGQDCVNAVPLTPGTTQCATNSFSGSFPDGGGAPTNPCDGLYNDGEYWFEYTGTGDQLVLDMSGLTATYSGLFVLNDCPGSSPSCVASHTSGASTANFQVTTPPLTAGQTYYIVIANWSAPYSTDFCLDATEQTPPPAGQQECLGGTTVCDDSQISGNSSGSGLYQELDATNQGCMTTEHQSSWYLFQAETAGSIEFTISPVNGTDDYDFAIWGSYAQGSTASTMCPPSSAPLLCSWAAGGGDTGLLDGSGDNTEGAGGDGFVENIDANAGDTYILLIDNFSATASPFDLSWNLSSGASLDCAVLPVLLKDFYGSYLPNKHSNQINWITKTEVNADYFILEKSTDGTNFEYLTEIKAIGNSSIETTYDFVDENISSAISYYRLIQVDLNGKKTVFGNISIQSENNISLFPNPSNGELNISLASVPYEYITVEFIDINGKNVSEKIVLNEAVYTSQSFEHLAKGIYFVNVKSPSGEILQTEKVVKY